MFVSRHYRRGRMKSEQDLKKKLEQYIPTVRRSRGKETKVHDTNRKRYAKKDRQFRIRDEDVKG
jgi:hypothetical protein